MSLILPASSSPELKAFPLCSKSSKSSEGRQSWPLRAQWRDSVIYSAPLPLHSINPTDSPSLASMLVGQCFYSDVGARGGKTLISRLNLYPSATCRARTGLPPMAFAVSFRIRFAEAKTAGKHHRPTHIRPLEPHHICTLISRPEDISCAIYLY